MMAVAYRPLYIVIVNWNLSDDTIECIESLSGEDNVVDPIIVVDNGSTDGSLQRLRARFHDSDVSIVCSDENVGFASGANLGIKEALSRGAASVLLLNNDTVADSDAVNALVRFGESAAAPLVLGPAIYYFDHSDQIWKLGDIHLPLLPVPYSVQKLRKYRKHLETSTPFQVDYVTGCGMLVHRAVFEEIGLFDQRYFMYFEDADFCSRAREAEFGIVCVPQSVIWHKVSKSANRDRPLNRYHRMLNQIRFYHSHTRGFSLLLLQAYLLVNYVRMLVTDILNRDFQLVVPTFKAYIAGYTEQFKWLSAKGAR